MELIHLDGSAKDQSVYTTTWGGNRNPRSRDAGRDAGRIAYALPHDANDTIKDVPALRSYKFE